MDTEHEQLSAQLKVLEEKVDAAYKSAEKIRKYILVIIWITVIAFVLPLVGLFFAIPAFLNTYLGSLDGLL